MGALDAMSEVLQALDAFGLMRIGVLGFLRLFDLNSSRVSHKMEYIN